MAFEFLRIPLDMSLEEASEEIRIAQERVGGGAHALVLGLDGFGGALQVYVTDVDRGDLPAPLAHHFSGRLAEIAEDLVLPEPLAGGTDEASARPGLPVAAASGVGERPAG